MTDSGLQEETGAAICLAVVLGCLFTLIAFVLIGVSVTHLARWSFGTAVRWSVVVFAVSQVLFGFCLVLRVRRVP